jgi:hypothetical protein
MRHAREDLIDEPVLEHLLLIEPLVAVAVALDAVLGLADWWE